MKKITVLLFYCSIVVLFLSSSSVYAADLEVVFENDPLFSQAIDGDWLPGRSETRWVTVANNSSDDKTVIVETFNKIAAYSEDLSDVLELTITAGGADVYGASLGTKYLTDFYSETELPLSILLAGHSVTYNFIVSLDKSVGNSWQNKDTGFDLRIGFYGKTVSQTPTPTPGGAGCTASAPVDSPVLSITAVGENFVSLSWTAVSPVTHYLIAYGLSEGDYIYGNPNVGNVLSYAVSGLSGGTTYYFVVRGVNDCAPGPYSNEVNDISSGSIVTGPAEGFVPILGETTESVEGAGEEMFLGEATEVKKKSVCSCWWLLLLLLLLLLFFLIYYYRRRPRRTR